MSARLELEDGTRYPLSDQPVLIGRGDQCDIVIAHEKVSKRHARLTPGSPWTVEDLGSSNGTRVDDGAKLEARKVTELGPTAQLTFGTVRVHFADFTPLPIAPSEDPEIPRSTRARATKPATPTTPTTRTQATTPAPVPAAPPADRGAPSSRRARSRQRIPGAPRSTVSVVTLAVLSLVIFGGLGAGLVWVYQWATPKPDSIARTDAEDTVTPAPTGPVVESPQNRDGDDGEANARRSDPSRSPEPRAPGTPREPRTGIGDDPFDEPGRVASESGTESREPNRPTEETNASVSPPPRDPFARASEIQHAGLLAELIRENRSHPSVDAVRARLEGGTILSITWRGGLPATAHATLGEQLPLHCTPQDVAAIRAVAPNAVFVPCAVAIDYRQDYTRGLGRKIGKTRLAPHPKTVEWTITREERGKQVRVAAVEAKTPRIPAAELGELGLSEREVWNRTVARRAEKLRNAFGRLIRD